MAVVLESTTEPQAEMDAAVGLPAGDQTNTDQEEQRPGAGEQPAGSAAASGAAKTENEEEQGGKGGKAGKGGVQKRIDTLTRRMREQEEELAALRRQSRNAGEQTERREAQPQKRPKPLPTDAKYSGPTAYEDYIEDLADWKAEQKFDELSNKRQQAELSQAEQERLQENFDAHLGRVEEARDRYDDFDEVTSARDVPIPAAVQAAIVESDISADLIYHLYKTPEDRKALLEAGEKSAASAVRLLGKIETKVEAELAKAKKAAGTAGGSAEAGKGGNANAGGAAANSSTQTPKPRAASAAPAPITPVGGAQTRTTIDRSKLSYQEFKRLRQNGTIR